MYFIITDKDDMYCGHKFTTGMNEIQKYYYTCTSDYVVDIIGNKFTCLAIYTSLDAISEINNYIKDEITSKIYIRFVCFDQGSILNCVKQSNIYLLNSGKIFLSDKYFIFCPKTIKKFNIKITKQLVSMACANNYIDFLDWYESEHNYYDSLPIYISSSYGIGSGYHNYYDSLPIDMASAFGNTDVLEWWLNSTLPLKYSEKSLISASINGHINVLTWWFKSGLPLEYNEHVLNLASAHGHINVLTWWFKSGLPLKYDHNALNLASAYGHINVLTWWFKSGLPLKYDHNALNFASKNGYIGVLEWWLNSGLKLKYTETALDWASHKGHVNVLEWWLKSGLELKYTRLAVKIPDMYKKMDVVAWWKDSGLPLAFESINHTITKIPSKTTSKKKKVSFINKIFSVFSKNKN